MSRPVIAVTASPDDPFLQKYASAVERNGGDPWLILTDHREPPGDTLARAGGLLVSGGEDVDPALYGRAGDPEANVRTNPLRDAMELPMLRAALERDMPVLCLCRGLQVLNVVMGGTLIQHIDGHAAIDENGKWRAAFHHIYISSGSRLAAAVGAGGFARVNSWHHQGVREPQKSARLLASAYALKDGTIEALESLEHDWVLGVQFHPEIRGEVPPHFEGLFQGLVARAVRRSAGAAIH